jgi:hypothetical protein
MYYFRLHNHTGGDNIQKIQNNTYEAQMRDNCQLCQICLLLAIVS